jgi:hypothetical protein
MHRKLGTDVNCDCGLASKNCLEINDRANGLAECIATYITRRKAGKRNVITPFSKRYSCG